MFIDYGVSHPIFNDVSLLWNVARSNIKQIWLGIGTVRPISGQGDMASFVWTFERQICLEAG